MDAAFSRSIYLWDPCFRALYAKYHQDELPIAQSLDNFARQRLDSGTALNERCCT